MRVYQPFSYTTESGTRVRVNAGEHQSLPVAAINEGRRQGAFRPQAKAHDGAPTNKGARA